MYMYTQKLSKLGKPCIVCKPLKSGEQSSANRCLQYDKQTCNVPDNDAADNTILTNVDDSPHKSHSEHSPLCTVPTHVSKGANQ